jgi:hypothetical protein
MMKNNLQQIEVLHIENKEIRVYHYDDTALMESFRQPIDINSIDAENEDIPWKIRKKLKKGLPILLEDTQDRRKFYDRNDLLKIVTPLWANKDDIKQIYEEAKRLTIETGIKHQVDHIIPLKHSLVCGLHVKENLRVITQEENYKKTNKFIVE